MSDYTYDDDSDDAVDQDDAPADAAAPTQDDAGAAADLPDVTGGYDMSADPAMMDDVLNGAGSWPGGDYDMSSDPAMMNYLNGAASWPVSSGDAATDASAPPVSKSVPIVPSDQLGGARTGPAIVQTLADTVGNSGPATSVPITANAGAGLAALSGALGSGVLVVPGDYADAGTPPPFDSSLAGSDNYAAQQPDPAEPGSGSVQAAVGSQDLLGGRHFVRTPTGDGSLESDAPSTGDGATLTNVSDRQSGLSGAQLNGSARLRPGPTEPDPVVAQLAAQHPEAVPPGFYVDPRGVITRFNPSAAGNLLDPNAKVFSPVSAEEQQRVINSLLDVDDSQFGTGQLSDRETGLRLLANWNGGKGTPLPKSVGAAALALNAWPPSPPPPPGLNGHGYEPQPGDAEKLARMIFAETSDIPEDANAIGWAIVNRIGQREYGSNMDEVFHGRNAFQPLREGGGPEGNSGQWNASADPRDLTGPDADSWRSALAAANGILNRRIPDPTGGATLFFSSDKYNGKPETAKGRWFQQALRSGAIQRAGYASGSTKQKKNYFFTEPHH